jgi:hypothetical protein
MEANPNCAADLPHEPEEQHEPVSDQLQRVFDALSEARRTPLPRGRAQESSPGFWTIKPNR